MDGWLDHLCRDKHVGPKTALPCAEHMQLWLGSSQSGDREHSASTLPFRLPSNSFFFFFGLIYTTNLTPSLTQSHPVSPLSLVGALMRQCQKKESLRETHTHIRTPTSLLWRRQRIEHEHVHTWPSRSIHMVSEITSVTGGIPCVCSR